MSFGLPESYLPRAHVNGVRADDQYSFRFLIRQMYLTRLMLSQIIYYTVTENKLSTGECFLFEVSEHID